MYGSSAVGCLKACMLSVPVYAMQDKLLVVVKDSLDMMQKKIIHNVKDFTSLDVSFVVRPLARFTTVLEGVCPGLLFCRLTFSQFV